eukprot:jgi/Astpho2/9471/Aster-01725
MNKVLMLQVSVISFGSWVTFGTTVDVNLAKQLMQQCYEAGVNFFDNAEVYASGKAEEVMGQAFKELQQEKGWKREEIVFSTKIFWGSGGDPNAKGLSRKHIIEGTKASLKRFQLDYVDLLFCHRPDVATPIEETVRAMNWCIDQGLAFYWGTSEWSAQQITEAAEIADRLHLLPPIMDQCEYNLLKRDRVEAEYGPLYEKRKMGLTIWSPLASGVLSGKYSKDHIPEGSRLADEKYKGIRESSIVDATLSKVDALKPIAEELGCTLAQLAVAWCASNENVTTVITGATKTEQLKDNLAAVELVPKFTPELMKRIDDIVKTKPEPLKTYGRG